MSAFEAEGCVVTSHFYFVVFVLSFNFTNLPSSSKARKPFYLRVTIPEDTEQEAGE